MKDYETSPKHASIKKVHATTMNEIPSSFFDDLQVYFSVKSLISDLTFVDSKNQKLPSKYLYFYVLSNFFPDEEATLH